MAPSAYVVQDWSLGTHRAPYRDIYFPMTEASLTKTSSSQDQGVNVFCTYEVKPKPSGRHAATPPRPIGLLL